MTKSEENELFIKSLLHFGVMRQWDKLSEEMSELNQAIMKYRYKPTQENIQNLYEEIVDVEIVLAQLKTGISKRQMKVHKRNKIEYLKSIIERKISVA